jgi:hypothetical protein
MAIQKILVGTHVNGLWRSDCECIAEITSLSAKYTLS